MEGGGPKLERRGHTLGSGAPRSHLGLYRAPSGVGLQTAVQANHPQTGDYAFSLPDETQVLARNRTITTYYAQLYRSAPALFKWAGMAAFASFHIGKHLERWDWAATGVKSVDAVEAVESGKSRELMAVFEADFQIIRIINNQIFAQLGENLLDFAQQPFVEFLKSLEQQRRDPIVVEAFVELDAVREALRSEPNADALGARAWAANLQLLWHEQSQVVQPMFDRLSEVFSSAMTMLASFDYSVNHRDTRLRERSRFVRFMWARGQGFGWKTRLWPDVTELDQRWAWLEHDVVPRWRAVEQDQARLAAEIEHLAGLVPRRLSI